MSITFHLPTALHASTPPERRGIRRDQVRLMVSDKHTGESIHTSFHQLPQFLRSGDVLVLNASRTIPALLYGKWYRQGQLLSDKVEIRLAHRLDERIWQALVITEGVKKGDFFYFSTKLFAEVIRVRSGFALIEMRFSLSGAFLFEQIYALGQPIRYEYVQNPWQLEYYQTVYGSFPGSVELPSAGRAFTWEMLFRLKQKGISIAFLLLHTGLSYFLGNQVNPEENGEEYMIPDRTATLVNQAKQSGGRVIAVGTTVVRALESAVSPTGQCMSTKGWTRLYIHSHYSLQLVDGLLTGFHEPEASHLDLLTAFVESHQLKQMYDEAIQQQYLWHEFGDLHLILPIST
ncbi:S-adenosylmethionine:tRNA ribosyltransferase-isomerase [Thermoflavimicrobium dichotomicum]|uniref:S-adenosylmethionine:tRNA ribosyltransferase-isomerase n=1 Tax=Thermoflavimicrobium dichotomicum TaxID=46223 RepID=A0A1I3MDR5_9BACL|nr:S-adenosylmethionine:tRNA ribosyltransferase-isomerase [Thermoflavimicrobium dichotomicum]SFI94836.1 S-adenosylmethionine:tRNA ribosyltransferase-isomerase [Thermoflavimicrobium dichotomicum]